MVSVGTLYFNQRYWIYLDYFQSSNAYLIDFFKSVQVLPIYVTYMGHQLIFHPIFLKYVFLSTDEANLEAMTNTKKPWKYMHHGLYLFLT